MRTWDFLSFAGKIDWRNTQLRHLRSFWPTIVFLSLAFNFFIGMPFLFRYYCGCMSVTLFGFVTQRWMIFGYLEPPTLTQH